MCIIQTSHFIAQYVACKNKYRNKYLDYVTLGYKTHLFACKDLYEKLMHFMHLECTCIGRKSLHIFEHAFPSVLVKNFIFRGMFKDVYYFVCTQSLFFQVSLFTSLVLLHVRYPFSTHCYLGKYAFSLSEQPRCKYFRISVVFVYGVNYKLLQLKKYMK